MNSGCSSARLRKITSSFSEVTILGPIGIARTASLFEIAAIDIQSRIISGEFKEAIELEKYPPWENFLDKRAEFESAASMQVQRNPRK